MPTMIAGVYGMNFDVMPELRWRWGYPVVMTATVALAGSCTTASSAPAGSDRIIAVMRVLVMGGTEFISLHLLRALQQRGHEVTVFNRGASSRPAAPRGRDRRRPEGSRGAPRAAARHPVDGVYDVTYAPTLPEDVTALVDALPGSPHVFFVSTCRVYDHAPPGPLLRGDRAEFLLGRLRRHKIGGEDGSSRASGSAGCR